MDAVKELRYFFLILFILAIVWLFTGGPLRPESKSGLFLNDPQGKRSRNVQKETDEITGTQRPGGDGTSIAEEQEDLPKDTAILKRAKARSDDPNEEYIEIRAAKGNKNAINVSGWKLTGKSGLSLPIGYGTYVYTPGISNPEENIFLQPGGKIIVATGHSPLGVNLLLTKCTGYLDQEKRFSPRLSRDCPLIEEEPLPDGLSDSCLGFIEDISKCEIIDTIPAYLNSSCQSFLSEKVNYKSCVNAHRYDEDFYGNEWRVFLKRNEELWKQSREEIKLLDESGNLIDSIAY